MADRYTEVVILCEDLMHLNFVRRYLIHRGVQSRRIRVNMSPSGRGAGAQYVIENYPLEVKALRSRSYLRVGLVAVIDADTSSVEDRLRQLRTSLMQHGQPDRGATERIALLSPKRNVETWIFYLLGNEANEEEDYKRRVSTSDTKEAVAALTGVCPQRANEIRLPSLRHACDELTTLLARGI
jgi:hypothetical protein